jgi:hypothetical protein
MLRAIWAAATALSTVAGLLSVSAPAQADTGDIVCLPPSSSTGTYTPPLTLTPQTVTVQTTEVFGPCTSLAVPAITSGLAKTTVTVPGRTCLVLLGSGTATRTITWNTGQTSTITENFSTQIVGGVFTVTVTGIVTDGLFQGDTIVRNQSGPATDILLCEAGLGAVSSVYTIGTTIFT